MKKSRFRKIIWEQFDLYPEMEIQDLYKLVYQGVMGSGHAVSSEAAAQNWLQQELAGVLNESHNEPLAEDISADGKVLRINLRPYSAAGGDTDRLLTSFIRTGREYRGTNEELIFWWKAAASIDGCFGIEEMTEFIEVQQAAYFPAVHHSQGYRDLYKPSYRVVLREICFEEGVLT